MAAASSSVMIWRLKSSLTARKLWIPTMKRTASSSQSSLIQ